jgi:hypothetical protein
MKIDNKILKAELIDWQIIKDLQPNNLKNPTNQKALRESLKKHGFSKAFDVWQDGDSIYFVDGHTRADMLRELVTDGFEIPDKLMCNFLDVKTRKEAIQKLLEVHNQKLNQINSEVGIDWVVEEGVEDVAWDWLNVESKSEDLDYSDKNKEIELNDLGNESSLVFKFDHTAYLETLARLNNAKEKLGCDTNEETLLKLLENYE